MKQSKLIKINHKEPIEPSLSAGCYLIAYLLFFIVLVLSTMMVSQIFFISTEGLLSKFLLFLLFVSPYFAFPWWIDKKRQRVGQLDLTILEQTTDDILFALTFEPQRVIHISKIDAILTIYEYRATQAKKMPSRKASAGSKRAKYVLPETTYLARQQTSIDQSFTIAPNQNNPIIEVPINIPPNMPATYHEQDDKRGTHCGVSWTITITMGLKGWVDWQQSFSLKVKGD